MEGCLIIAKNVKLFGTAINSWLVELTCSLSQYEESATLLSFLLLNFSDGLTIVYLGREVL